MTIANTTNSIREAGNGSKVDFDFDFTIYATSDIKVYKILNSTEARTLQVINTDYTVEISEGAEGGTVTFVTAPTALQDSFIERELPFTQATNIPAVGGIREEQIEKGLDKLCILLLQLKRSLQLAPKFVSSSEFLDVIFPEGSANKVIGWADDGETLENKTLEVTETQYSGTISAGLDAAKPASPTTDDIYVATDTETLYICFSSGTWTALAPDGALFTNLANITAGAGRIPKANLPLVRPVTIVTLTDAANIATDAALGDHFKVTLGGNRTLDNPTNPTDGQVILFEFIQDGTGSRTITLGSDFIFGTDVTSVTLTTTASKRDFMVCKYRGSKWCVLGFSRGYA